MDYFAVLASWSFNKGVLVLYGGLYCFIFVSNNNGCLALWRADVYSNPHCDTYANYSANAQVTKVITATLNNLVNASLHDASFNTSVVVGHNSSNTNSSFTVYGLFQCRGDKTAAECYQCSHFAKNVLQQTCLGSLRASVWANDTCFMRYRDTNFLGYMDTNQLQGPPGYAGVVDPDTWRVVMELLMNLSVQAGLSPTTRYATGYTRSDQLIIYGMVQCWRSISMHDCGSCLNANLDYIIDYFSGRKEAQSVSKSCLVQYAPYQFFRSLTTSTAATSTFPSSPSRSTGSSGSVSKAALAAEGIGGSILIILLGGFVVWFKRKRETGGALDVAANILEREDPIIFTVEVLKNATNNFHDDVKLGEGGFGAVYKGTLPNGREIAVKILSSTSKGGRNQLMNEIKLLVQIQHRNLVSLLGYCDDAVNIMLVYEYLSKKSVDKILFDPDKETLLDWPQRFHMILGIAKGLQYLHEDSKVKIIHRDIKAANILLDDNFNPKIADFGLAKLLSDDETKIHTKIAGTYGYMAPEYAMKGQLSIKADVYSFGVLVFEIISGRKWGDLDANDGHTILTKIWRSFQEGNVEEIVDESITSSISYEHVKRCIHVGLLCTQADSSLRPPMSTVYLMLTGVSSDLPDPALPAFLSFSLDSDSTSSHGNQMSMTLPR